MCMQVHCKDSIIHDCLLFSYAAHCIMYVANLSEAKVFFFFFYIELAEFNLRIKYSFTGMRGKGSLLF